MIQAQITRLEDEGWEAMVGPDINDPAADAYSIVKTPAGLCLLVNSTKPYGGWLAKNVAPLLFAAPRVSLLYTVMVDDATAVAAQVIETDAKITDSHGWTYDLSAQWNIAEGWIFQIDDAQWTWTDTGIRVQPFEPLIPVHVVIDYELDYAAHASSIIGVKAGREHHGVDPKLGGIPAKQVGWAPGEIVTQLQQVTNGKAHGGYELRFSGISYRLEDAE